MYRCRVFPEKCSHVAEKGTGVVPTNGHESRKKRFIAQRDTPCPVCFTRSNHCRSQVYVNKPAMRRYPSDKGNSNGLSIRLRTSDCMGNSTPRAQHLTEHCIKQLATGIDKSQMPLADLKFLKHQVDRVFFNLNIFSSKNKVGSGWNSPFRSVFRPSLIIFSSLLGLMRDHSSKTDWDGKFCLGWRSRWQSGVVLRTAHGCFRDNKRLLHFGRPVSLQACLHII